MTQLGISVYPDLRPLDEIRDYIRLAAKYNVTRVFSSMFSAEGSNEQVLACFKELIGCAHEAGMKVTLDVNPAFFHQLGATCEDLSLFHEIGTDILRMDISFGKEKDLVLIRNPYGIGIELNASFGAETELSYMQEHGVGRDHLVIGHNFYPQRYTGLKWKTFTEINEKLKPYGYPLEAFIASHNKDTHGVWDARDGLPTVEKLRDLPCDLQARILSACGISHIYFGNAYASEEEFASLQDLLAQPKKMEDSPLYPVFSGMGLPMPKFGRDIVLKIKAAEDLSAAEEYTLFELFPHVDFGDSSEWIWRSRTGRMLKGQSIVPRKYEKELFEPGDVLIVNDNYAHYAGEVQIARLPLVNDGTRNYAGHLKEGEEILLDLVRDMDVVSFRKG